MGEVAPERRRVELILAGRYEDAGVSPPRVRPELLTRMADALRDKCAKSFSATPEDLAAAAGLTVTQTLWLTDADVCVDRQRIVVAHADRQVCGLRILRGVAIHLLASAYGRHTEADVILLAAELAEPSQLVLRSRLASEAARRDVPTWFLRAWERSWLGPPSEAPMSR
jgi:hypothetical protein